jgi:hypothetical protein
MMRGCERCLSIVQEVLCDGEVIVIDTVPHVEGTVTLTSEHGTDARTGRRLPIVDVLPLGQTSFGFGEARFHRHARTCAQQAAS